jgi:integrase/recombinase XerD
MTASPGFVSSMAEDLGAFLAFKRARGHRYLRAEFTLRSFDRHLLAATRSMPELSLEQATLTWLASFGPRKAVSVAVEFGVIREFCRYRRRRDPDAFVPGRAWAPQSAESDFLPHIFSDQEVRTLLGLTANLRGGPFRATVFHLLILVLYTTGLRFGEAVRLRLRDVDMHGPTFYIAESKGRSRLVPFGDDLARAVERYLAERRLRADEGPDRQLFVRPDGLPLTTRAASDTVRLLLRKAGLKPSKGRAGPRPYDLRHTFAVRRLEAWYRDGADIHAQLPWLSAYMGHYDLTGTEHYLLATPALLGLAADRLRARLAGGEGSP